MKLGRTTACAHTAKKQTNNLFAGTLGGNLCDGKLHLNHGYIATDAQVVTMTTHTDTLMKSGRTFSLLT